MEKIILTVLLCLLACGVSFSQTNYSEKTNQGIALSYSFGFLTSNPTNVLAYVNSKAKSADEKTLGIMAASTTYITSIKNCPVFDALVNANTNLNLFTVIENPELVLDDETIMLLQLMVIDIRGVAAQVIPPPDCVSMRLVPPIAPVYENQ